MSELQTDSSAKQMPEWATTSAWHLTYYFGMMENDPENRPAFKGYGALAKNLEQALDTVTTSEAPETILLPLKPKADLNGRSVGDMPEHEQLAAYMAAKKERLYEEEQLAASQALILLAYKALRAECLEPVSVIDEETGRGDVVMHGIHNEKHVYFIEHHDSDEYGNYMTWTVATEVPSDLSRTPQTEEQPFLTTSQREELRHDVFDDISQLPTALVDEAQVVRDWITRRAA